MITLEALTKGMAAQWLGKNLPNNRPISNETINRYQRSMDTGKWIASPEAVICLDPLGRLLNGQHRLRAFVASKLNLLQTYVARNVPASMAFHFDQGKKRSPGNQLAMLGYANSTNLAAVAKKLWFYLVNDGPVSGSGASIVNNDDILGVIQKHNPALERCVLSAQSFYKQSGKLIPVSSAATLMYLFGRVDGNARTVFFTALETGRRESETSPIIALRRALRSAQAERRRLWGNSVIGEALIIKAWNAWRAGTSVSVLSFKDAEAFPKIAGLKI